MNILELIEKLKNIYKVEGDLPVVRTESDDYWGTLYYDLEDNELIVTDHAQPEGPKSGKAVRAVSIESKW